MRKNANRKLLQLLCGLLCAALIFAAAPRAAAEDPVVDMGPLEIYGRDGAWTYQDGVYRVFDSIAVAGENRNDEDEAIPLTFIFEDYCTITWSAGYVFSADDAERLGLTADDDIILVDVQGEGYFEMFGEPADEIISDIVLDHPGTALRTGEGVELYMTSAKAEASCENGYAVAIEAGSNVTVVDESEVYAVSKFGAPDIAIQSENAIEILVYSSTVEGDDAAILAPLATLYVEGEEDLPTRIVTRSLLWHDGAQLYGNAIMANSVFINQENIEYPNLCGECIYIHARNGAAIMYSDALEIHGGMIFGFGHPQDTDSTIGGGSFQIEADDTEVAAILNVIFKADEGMAFAPGVPYSDQGADELESCINAEGNILVLAFEHDVYEEAPRVKLENKMFLSALEAGDYTYEWRSGSSLRYSVGVLSGYVVPFLDNLPGKPMIANPAKDDDGNPDDPNNPDPTDDPGDTNLPNGTAPVPITPRPPLVVESEPEPTPAAAPKERAKPRPLPPLPEPTTVPAAVPTTEPATEPTAPTTEPTTEPSAEPVAGPSTPTGGESGSSSSGTASPGTTAPASRPPAAGGQQQTTEPTEPTTEPSTEPTEPAPQGVTAQAPTTTVPAATEPIATPTAPVNPQDIAPPPEEKTGLAAAVPAIIGGGAVVTAGAGAAWVFKGWRKP